MQEILQNIWTYIVENPLLAVGLGIVVVILVAVLWLRASMRKPAQLTQPTTERPVRRGPVVDDGLDDAARRRMARRERRKR